MVQYLLQWLPQVLLAGWSQSRSQLNEPAAVHEPKTSHSRRFVLLQMPYYLKLKHNGWVGKIETTRNRFRGHLCTKKTFNQILYRSISPTLCGNVQKLLISEKKIGLALRVRAQYSCEKFVTWRVTGIIVRSKLTELSPKRCFREGWTHTFDWYCITLCTLRNFPDR